MPPKRLNPMPPAPRRIMSRRETPLSFNRLLITVCLSANIEDPSHVLAQGARVGARHEGAAWAVVRISLVRLAHNSGHGRPSSRFPRPISCPDRDTSLRLSDL